MKIELESNQATLSTIPTREYPINLLKRIGLSVVILACSLAVFLLGTNYVEMFPTNGNTFYAASLTGIFLVAALLLKRSTKLAIYWPLAYAFFIASAVNLISCLFAGYNTEFVSLFGSTRDENRIMALAKLYETILVVVPIIVLTLISGADLGSIFLKIGNQNYKWGFGIGGLVLANFFTSVLIFFGPGYELAKLGPVIGWSFLFSICNALSEELWIRGLFMKKMFPIIGIAATILVTSITFGMLHMTSVVYLPSFAVPIFLINTFTLGLTCSILMHKTDSIWGAYLIHMAADVFMFIATLAVR
jgi:membrane protease YdiL (CAAX protease family)